jgi:hypothetical protein
MVFREEQRFTQRWLWALVVVATVAAWVGLVAAVVDPGDDGSSWVVVVAAALVGVGLPVLFGLACLTTEVWPDRVVIRYRPFTTRTIVLSEVTRVDSVSYDPVREYGGWGIKGWTQRKVAYNVSGNRGALLRLADGRTVLIGSPRADELAAAVRRHVPAGT